MDEFDGRDRFKPFLLDRFQDPEGGRPSIWRAASGLVAEQPPLMTGPAYRDAVVRDLQHLLNTVAPPPQVGLRDRPLLAGSVLNFGLPDVSTLSREQVAGGELERLVTEAIERFEPRILSRALRVRASDGGGGGSRIELLIEGELWALPVPEAVRLRTELDLQSGQWNVKDR